MPVDAALHHWRRHHQRVFIDCGTQADGDQLPWPQVAVLVVELSLDPHRAGVGRDLVVDQCQVAFAEQVAFAIGVHVGLHQRRGWRLEQSLQGWQHLLRQCELDGDRVDLGDAEQALRIRGAHQVAGVDIADADAPGHG